MTEREALDRADRLINAMAKYIGQMALDAGFFFDLNQHGVYMAELRHADQEVTLNVVSAEERVTGGMVVCSECGGWGEHMSTCSKYPWRDMFSEDAPNSTTGGQGFAEVLGVDVGRDGKTTILTGRHLPDGCVEVINMVEFPDDPGCKDA